MSAAMHGQESRVIHYAVLASIVLHGLLLLGFSMRDASRRAAAAPAPIVARLVQPEPVAPTRAQEPQPPAVKPAVDPVVKPVVKPQPAPKPPPLAKAAPKAPPPQPAPPPTEPAAPVPEAQAATPAPSAPPVPAASVQASPSPSAGDLDAGALVRYRFEVSGRAAKLKVYPRAAIDNNWQGRVIVAVTVRANGLAICRVRVSSGHPVLDQQALDMITRAQSLAEIPAALRGREFAFEIPVDFDLKQAPG